MAKKIDLVNGVCFRTTEFSNGYIFINGVWYTPRNLDSKIPLNEKIVYKLNALTIDQSDETSEDFLDIDLHPRYPSKLSTRELIVWNKGGCWEC